MHSSEMKFMSSTKSHIRYPRDALENATKQTKVFLQNTAYARARYLNTKSRFHRISMRRPYFFWLYTRFCASV